MGKLLSDGIDFNTASIVTLFRAVIQSIVSRPDSYHILEFKPSFYFSIAGPRLPDAAGWYILMDDCTPLYVGKAGNLDNRLNTNQGSLDQFAKKARTSEPERNFIKKLIEIGDVQKPRVCIILQAEVANQLVGTTTLSPIDVANVEKMINLTRDQYKYV